ncbi:YlxM family DNA-binding protein [bacterium]|nr:YlxM family DNA-binding protein [bacterium]
MASQVVSAQKRYRMSLLLDIYGELLTEKQRSFMQRYFEQDMSFGEIAREQGVSRQAIFDAVKHGEESLEKFERVLKLVETGWADYLAAGLTPKAIVEKLVAIRGKMIAGNGASDELDGLIKELSGAAELEESSSPSVSEG